VLRLLLPEVRDSLKEVPFSITTTGSTENPALAVTFFTGIYCLPRIIANSIAKVTGRIPATGTFHKEKMWNHADSPASGAYQLPITVANLALRTYQRGCDSAGDKET